MMMMISMFDLAHLRGVIIGWIKATHPFSPGEISTFPSTNRGIFVHEVGDAETFHCLVSRRRRQQLLRQMMMQHERGWLRLRLRQPRWPWLWEDE